MRGPVVSLERETPGYVSCQPVAFEPAGIGL